MNNELEQQRVLLDEGLFVDDKANPRDVLRELDRVRKTLDEIKAQTVTLQGYQVSDHRIHWDSQRPLLFFAHSAHFSLYFSL